MTAFRYSLTSFVLDSFHLFSFIHFISIMFSCSLFPNHSIIFAFVLCNLIITTYLPSDDAYDVILKKPVAPGERSSLGVTVVLIDGYDAYPSEMPQNERQTILFLGNHYFYSPYRTLKQTTDVVLATTRVEHWTQLKPSKRDGKKLTFGPYESFVLYPQCRHILSFLSFFLSTWLVFFYYL